MTSAKLEKKKLITALKNDKCSLEEASDHLKADPEVALESIKSRKNYKQYAGEFKYFDESLKNDPDFILKAIRFNQRILKYTSQSINSNREMLLASLNSKWVHRETILQYLDFDLRSDKEFVIAAFKKHSSAIEYASFSLRSDKEVAIHIVKDGFYLQELDFSLRSDKEIVLPSVLKQGSSLGYADFSLRSDKEVIKAAVTGQGYAITEADYHLWDDDEIKLASGPQNTEINREIKSIIEYCPEYEDFDLRSNKKFLLTKIKEGKSFYYQYASFALRSDKEVALAAVKADDSFSLDSASFALRSDKEVVLASLKKNSFSFFGASFALRSDKEVVLAAVKLSGNGLCSASFLLCSDKKLVITALKHAASGSCVVDIIENISHSLKEDKDIVLEAFNQAENSNRAWGEPHRKYELIDILYSCKNKEVLDIIDNIKKNSSPGEDRYNNVV